MGTNEEELMNKMYDEICDEESEYDSLIAEGYLLDEDELYTCMSCGYPQSKSNGMTCGRCAGPLM